MPFQNLPPDEAIPPTPCSRDAATAATVAWRAVAAHRSHAARACTSFLAQKLTVTFRPPPSRFSTQITSLGEGGTGKSCLIKRYCEERFVQRYISTIGVDFGVKPVTIYDYQVKVNFWDLSGHPEFFEVRNEFYKDTQGAMLVYDISSRKSFEALNMWVKEAAKFAGGTTGITFVLCGNKNDKKRVVPEAEGRAWADQHEMRFFETSAKSGENVNEMFEYLFTAVVESIPGLTD